MSVGSNPIPRTYFSKNSLISLAASLGENSNQSWFWFGSLFIFIVMMVGINVTGIAPFHMPPSAAFLTAIHMPVKPLAILLHFGYGFFWAAAAYAIFKDKLNIKNAVALAVIVQWLILMQLVFSPIIGWGILGLKAGSLPPDAPLALSSTGKYIVMTLVLHVVYGVLNGWLIPKWVKRPSSEEIIEGRTQFNH